jgi:N-acetyl-gamma-glutamyl-phosphate reductase
MTTPVVVLGGSGYVAGELLRLLGAHSGFELAAVVSESRAGAPVSETFPHLAGSLDGERFAPPAALEERIGRHPRLALVSAAPHGASAGVVAAAMGAAERAGTELAVVDLSADFRFADPDEYARLYGHRHPAPERLAGFARALPEHAAGSVGRAVAHPGCFPTAVLLAVVPLLEAGLVERRFAVTAITGSTGSGRTPSAKTHHPERRSNLVAYAPLVHRHAAEMRSLAAQAAGGERPEIDFVPVSGPQARGIYAVIQARLARAAGAAEVAERLTAFYAGSPFVAVSLEPPSLTEVVGTNRARLGLAVSGDALALTVAIDNLVKGAAGGAVQWLNRIHGLPEATGLPLDGLGWL